MSEVSDTTHTDQQNTPTPEPTPPTSGQSEIPAWAQQIIQQNQLLQQNNTFLAQQLNQLANQFQQPAPQQTIDPSEFHVNPVDVIGRVVEQRLQPLQQFVARTAQQQAIQEAVEFYASQDPDFGQFKQQFIGLLRNTEVNAQTAQAAYYAARGWFSTQPKTSAPAPAAPASAPQKGPDLSTVPAHLRPSGVQGGATNTQSVKLRPLSENEEMVRKTSRLSHAEYLYHRGEITKEQLLATQGKK